MSSLTIDEFNIKNVIGTGTFGKVFLIEKKDTGDVYAVKTVEKQTVLNHPVSDGFLME